MTGASADETLVREKLGALVREHGTRAQRDPAAFWGAQFDAGLAWVDFPMGLGGLAVRPALQFLVEERLETEGLPTNKTRNPIGVGVAASTIGVHGTDEQKQRHLRTLFICDEVWCQLYSEESAGSDLASVETLGQRRADDWEINGTKLWVTLAHAAKWGLLLARTDRDAPRHAGLTCFIVDMETDGVAITPVRQMTGQAELNQVTLTDVRVPDAQRVGEAGRGWHVAMTTLARERAWLGNRTAVRGSGPIGEAVRLWQDRPDKDPVLRDRLMQLWVEAEVVRLLSRRVAGLVPPVAAEPARPPGPAGAAAKLASAELNQRIYDFCLTLLGPSGMLYGSYEMDRPTEVGLEGTGVHRAFLRSRGATLEGGSSEIMRTILGERVLGFPRS
ncbi:MAG TPA: acyl-CoA dehydrogenase family protein [Acidimicrobiales bacterium]|nr:acyl-CoA dehydrogenase family protein [Acidimicrobiales bacterium]